MSRRGEPSPIVKALLDKASHLAGDVPPLKTDAAAIHKAQAAQLEALADLRGWFNDWGTALRSVLSVGPRGAERATRAAA